MKPLVSMISPCYNGAKYLHGFLDSVLAQTYRPIELIFVDDGSVDNTREIVLAYEKYFLEVNIRFEYVFQKNAGQAAAINRGLQMFQGEYLMWVDSDDVLMSENISMKVEYLLSHPEIDFVLCQGLKVDADNMDIPLGIIGRKESEPYDHMKLFKDLIMGRNVVFGPATILASRSAICCAIPSLHIYESRQGQNWQLMLPLAYKCNYGLIDQPLFKYVIHNDSSSHMKRTYVQEIDRINELEKIIKTTIKDIPGISHDELIHWNDVAHTKFLKEKLHLAYMNNEIIDADYLSKELMKIKEYNFSDSKMRFLLGRLYAKLCRKT